MKLEEYIKQHLRGEPTIRILDHATGKVIEEWTQPNILVLDARIALIAGVSLPTVNSTINKIKLGDDLGELATISGDTITFTAGSPGTISRTTGSFITDGFVVGDKVTIQGTTNNNIEITLTGVSALTLTATTGDAVMNETSTTAQISRGWGSAPSSPLDTYNETTMAATSFNGAVLFDAPYALTVGGTNNLQAIFNVTIVGADVIAAQSGSPTSVNMSSAALHVGSGKVFAYARFPQKSISNLVDISISWTVTWQ
jgi:hypothetical protein